MSLLKLLSIRGLLVVVVLLASMPSLFILVEMNLDTSRQTLTLAFQSAAGLADNLATTQKIIDAWLFSALDLLIEEPGVKKLNVNSVTPLFKNITDKMPMLEDILLLNTSGDVLVSAKERESFDLWDGSFWEALPRFEPEGYPQVGGVISRCWSADLKVIDSNGPDAMVTGLAGSDLTSRYIPYVQSFASGYVLLLVKASYMEECIKHFPSAVNSLSQKWVLAIFDASGSIMAYRASLDFENAWERERQGKGISESLWDYIERHGETGSFRSLWDEKEDCITGYAKIRLPQLQGDSPVHAVAVVSYFLSDILNEERNTALRFLFLSLFFVLGGLLFALGVGRKLLVAPIDQLTTANERFAMGALSSRADIQSGIREMRVLSKSFDDMADALEMQELKRRSENALIKEQAHKDYLTGVYNRRGGLLELERHIKEAKERVALLSIFFIDIDFFKNINDEYGHNEGDKMLKRVTFLLERHLRSGDVLCRYGGDEFLVILPKCAMAAAEAVWDRIEKEIQHLNESGKVPYLISLSHGLALFDPLAPVSVDNLIGEADVKMYEEKAKRKATR
ncbi:MAG: diguanylate cyclase [Synergistaceae bacterium]|nr:diguanylate cyclase [Synergistaceae bacterium]